MPQMESFSYSFGRGHLAGLPVSQTSVAHVEEMMRERETSGKIFNGRALSLVSKVSHRG
jgi:hypothetical protein